LWKVLLLFSILLLKFGVKPDVGTMHMFEAVTLQPVV